MNQQKTGGFLKELRKEKGITQEQLAEVFGVSSRTVSRWENGVNMPDLSLLAEIADLHEIPEGAYSIRKDGALALRRWRIILYGDWRTVTPFYR